jgi:Flp pilus assembly secretin CpaC
MAQALALAALLAGGPWASADEPATERDLLVSTHTRLAFERDVVRVAVADPEVVSFTTLNEREGLVLGSALGRTSVMIWFTDGTTASFLFHVRRDLSLLEDALHDVHPSIQVSSAPDRDAVVLRGTVPDITYSNAAEEMAQRYLDAARGGGRRRGSPGVRVIVPGASPAAAPDAAPAEAEAPNVEAVADVRAAAAVINLIRVDSLPGRLEDRMQDAIHALGAKDVAVRRLVRGRLADDAVDVFVLTGAIGTQTALVRALSVAQSLLGEGASDAIEVRADESGALSGGRNQRSSPTNSGTTPGGLSQLLGSSSTALRNLVGANLGRAKVIEAGNGRILSFVEVTDLPQVRVDIELYEVNCTRLKAFNSDFGVFASNFRQGSFNPARVAGSGAGTLQGGGARRVGSQGEDPDVQNVFSFLSGTLSNQLQISGDNFALDSILRLLEQSGFARSLSRPSLTVLSGEQAFFQVGGEIPVPQSLATNITTDGILNSIEFRPFGVQLNVRPLVGSDGEITLDVAPTISLPDANLTAGIRESTGTSQSTTAFRTRALQTTAKLADGHSLLLGGLISRNIAATHNRTPGLSDAPVIGDLFHGYEREGDEFQLVVVVRPVVLREPTTKARLWAYPDLAEHVLSRDAR